MERYQRIVPWTIILSVLVIKCKTEVTSVTSWTAYPTGRAGGHYILDKEELILRCAFIGNVRSVVWRFNFGAGGTIFSHSKGSPPFIPSSKYEPRIDREKSQFTTTSTHDLVITVDKEQDEGQDFICFADTEGDVLGPSKHISISDILVRPTSVILFSLEPPIVHAPRTIECVVDPVFKGEEVTDLRLKLGDTVLGTGNMSHSPGSISGTFRVAYAVTVEFTLADRGQSVQCEVTWMRGTSVETFLQSTPSSTFVFYPALSVTIDFPEDGIEVGDILNITCSASSYPPPKLRLYRQRPNEPAIVVQTVGKDTLVWNTVGNVLDDNSAFYCRADDNRHLIGVEFDIVSETKVLSVWYPPNVDLELSQPSNIVEGSSLVLTCRASGGNPQVKACNWSFQPRYVGRNNDLTCNSNRELMLDNVEYDQAGKYTCMTYNDRVYINRTTELLIQYSLKDISTSRKKTVYADPHQFATVNCTVLAFPAITVHSVKVAHNGVTVDPAFIVFTPLTDIKDGYLVGLSFSSVQMADYGVYDVTLDNGIGDGVNIKLRLLEPGIPETPYSVHIESLTAVSVTLSWLPGLNGGSRQTFTVYYRQEGDDNILYRDGIEDTVNGDLVQYKVEGLDASVTYVFQVQAKNEYGISPSQDEIFATTLEKPHISDQGRIKIYEDLAVLRWFPIEGNVSRSLIQQCNNLGEECHFIFNVSDDEIRPFLVLENDYLEHTYYLVMYQGTDEIIRQQFRLQDNRGSDVTSYSSGRDNIGSWNGIAICMILTSGVLLLLLIGTCIYLYRKGLFLKSRRLGRTPETNQAAAYENSAMSKMAQPQEDKPPSEYADLQNVTYEVVT